MLDDSPVFLKQWEDGMELDKAEFVNLPIWVNILDLPLKYWGMLERLMTTLGQPIKPDKATAMRNRVKYARYLVEMNIKEEFPNQLEFKNEHGVVVAYPVEYEWMPKYCDKCKRMGHETAKCKKEEWASKRQKKIWVPKKNQEQTSSEGEAHHKEEDATEACEAEKQKVTQEDGGAPKETEQEQNDTEHHEEQGFITVRRKSKKSYNGKTAEEVATVNSFSELQEDTVSNAQTQGGILSSHPSDGQFNSLEC